MSERIARALESSLVGFVLMSLTLMFALIGLVNAEGGWKQWLAALGVAMWIAYFIDKRNTY